MHSIYLFIALFSFFRNLDFHIVIQSPYLVAIPLLGSVLMLKHKITQCNYYPLSTLWGAVLRMKYHIKETLWGAFMLF